MPGDGGYVPVRLLAVTAATVLLTAGCGLGGSADMQDPPAGPATSSPATGGTPSGNPSSGSGSAAVAGTTGAAPAGTSSAAPSVAVAGSASTRPAGLTAADGAAGLRSATFSQSGSGRLVPVPGDVAAPGAGRRVTVRVEVESGLPIDPKTFAGFVMATLNDPRGWGHGGTLSFARTDGPAAVRVVLASPDTSARMCRPLQTFGRLSCRSGDAAVLTLYRWAKAIPEYGSDRTGYRGYVVNHEVGHALGHGHVMCSGRGELAPVMMQQTKGLKGCLPNSWPFP